MKFRKIAAGLAIILATLCQSVSAAATVEYKLKNGMTILVKEDHRFPTAVHMIWYKAGSMDETSGPTGVAHVLEHMMFKGTKKLKPGEFSRRVAALGGRENAFTSKDYTAYYQQIDQSRLEAVMKLEADRMANLKLSKAEFDPEIKVIMEERRWRTEDRATALLFETLNATAFTSHPYRHPIIGWMDDLKQMTAADARRWYQQWYAPNNATMVVVGDVDAKQVRRMAEKYFGRLPAKPLPAARLSEEPMQRGMRRVVVKAPADNPVVALAFKVPSLHDVDKDDDAYALDVLEAVLDGYDNARLSAALVRNDRVANSVGADYSTIVRGPALFIVSGTPAPGVSAEMLEARLRAELNRIAADGVTESELRRVKAQLIASRIYKRDSLFEQALEMGSMEMRGIPSSNMDKIIERLKAVTPQQVQAVAKKYFGDDALTVGTLVPLPVPSNGPRSKAPTQLEGR